MRRFTWLPLVAVLVVTAVPPTLRDRGGPAHDRHHHLCRRRDEHALGAYHLIVMCVIIEAALYHAPECKSVEAEAAG